MKQKIQAGFLETHTYGGKERQPGDVVNMPRQHFKALNALGWVDVYVPPPPKPRRQYRRKDMVAEPESSE